MSTGRCWTLLLVLAFFTDGGVALAGDDDASPRARGRALREAGDLVGAERALEEAVATAPQDAVAWWLLGTARNALSKYAEGAEACEKALAIDPSNARPRFDLGVALYNLSRSAEAAAHFDAVLAAEPQQGDATWMRAHCALRAGEFSEAEALFRRTAELARRYEALGPLYAGISASLAGRKADAGVWFQEACRAAPAGPVGVIAQAYRERLDDSTACETLLRPEDYFVHPAHGECTTAYEVPETGASTERGWIAVTVSADWTVAMDRPPQGVAARALLQAIDLYAVHSRENPGDVRGVIVPGHTCNGPLVRFDGRESPPDCASSYALAPRLLGFALCDGVSDEQALARRLEPHRAEIDFANAAGVLGDLTSAMREEQLARADAAARREAMCSRDVAGGARVGLALVFPCFINRHRGTASALETIARLVGASAGPAGAEARYVRDAGEAYAAGAFETAALLYRMALLRDPENVETRTCHGRALARTGCYDEAISDLEMAPGEDLETGRALLMTGRYDEAETRLKRVADSWHAAELLGLCHLWQSKWEAAEDCFRRAQGMRPERTVFHRVHLGLSLHAQGRTDEASAEWRACAEASPSSYYGMLARGLSTTRAEAAARRKVANDAAAAAVDKLSRGWGALSRIRALPQHEAAGALLEWLEAARKRGWDLGSALWTELTEARRASCGTTIANELLDEALRQARDDARVEKGEDAAAAIARERLLEVMKRCLSPQK